MSAIGGYAGKLLRVDLVEASFSNEVMEETELRKYIGGSGFGARYLYQEVPPGGVEWYDPENRLIITTGTATQGNWKAPSPRYGSAPVDGPPG